MPARRPSAWPPSGFVREQLAETRKRKGWTQQQLVDRMAELGAPMDRATITKIEKGQRRVSLDDAFHFAAALGVSPVHLMMPTHKHYSDAVAIAPALTVTARVARAWVRGLGPLVDADARFYFEQVSDEEFIARRERGVDSLLRLVHRLIDATIDNDREAMADTVDELQNELDRQEQALKREDK